MDITFESVETHEQVEDLAAMAAQIWGEYWPPIIGAAQTAYMVEKFQSVPAIERDMREHAYRYWFLVDGEGYVKEYRADGLHSHNPDYPVMTFAEDSDVRCVGRVLGKAEKQDWLSEEELAGMEGQE